MRAPICDAVVVLRPSRARASTGRSPRVRGRRHRNERGVFTVETAPVPVEVRPPHDPGGSGGVAGRPRTKYRLERKMLP
ncbi:MAG: hypothetical protein ACXQTZ_01285 [Candidatus Alkanophagales archaeon]